MKNKQFLIATDGSRGACEAVRRGATLAREAGAGITIVSVRHAPLPMLSEPFYQRALSDELVQVSASLAEAAVIVATEGVKFETEILEGRPASVIVEFARSRAMDLIIVGSRGRSAITSALLGSVSEDVAHHADRPVLVVKPRLKRRRLAA
jgi:nucleotide-binding universal stress UspA family protein